MRPNEPTARTDADSWLETLAREEPSPMPPKEAAALRARVVARIESQRARPVEREPTRARWRAATTFATAACLPFVVWGAVSASRAVAERRSRAANMTVVTLLGRGSAIARAGETRVLDAANPVTLTADDELRTGVDATAHASLPTGATVEVGPSARLRFERARGDRIDLLAGRIDVKVPKLGPGEEVSVHTSGAIVVVHGTRFSVEHSVPSAGDHGAGETRIWVAEGRVSVTTKQGERMLTGGSEFRVPEAVEAQGSAAVHEHTADAATEPPPAAASPPSALAASSSLAAENALLADALRLRRAGQNDRALVLLDELLDRYPRSPLAETARAERRRALDALRAPGSTP